VIQKVVKVLHHPALHPVLHQVHHPALQQVLHQVHLPVLHPVHLTDHYVHLQDINVTREEKDVKVKGHLAEVNKNIHQVMKVKDQQDKAKTNIHPMMKKNHINHTMKKQNIIQIDGKVEPNKKILFAHH